jgi:hypothetical protein
MRAILGPQKEGSRLVAWGEKRIKKKEKIKIP